MIPPGSLVTIHLIQPSEKFWGVLEALEPVGVTFRGLSLDAFEDWIHEVARREAGGVGLGTMFVPLFRIERIFLDEQVGGVESFSQRFERRVGVSVERFLGLTPGDDEIPS